MTDPPTAVAHKPTLWLATLAFLFAFVPGIIIIIYPPWRPPAPQCSTAMCQQSLTVRSQAFNVSPGSLQELSVACQQDELATGGGVRVEDDLNLNVWKSIPTASGRNWGVGVSNYGSANRSGTVYAVCIKVM